MTLAEDRCLLHDVLNYCPVVRKAQSGGKVEAIFAGALLTLFKPP